MCHGAWMNVRGRLPGVSSLIPPCVSGRLKSNLQACWQVFQPVASSYLSFFYALSPTVYTAFLIFVKGGPLVKGIPVP